MILHRDIKIRVPIHRPRVKWFEWLLNGWNYNLKKGCFEKYITMSGDIIVMGLNRWKFEPTGSGYPVYFYSKEQLKQAVINVQL